MVEEVLYIESLSFGRLFICSDYAKCISGEVINCDVGNHISSYF